MVSANRQSVGARKVGWIHGLAVWKRPSDLSRLTKGVAIRSQIGSPSPELREQWPSRGLPGALRIAKWVGTDLGVYHARSGTLKMFNLQRFPQFLHRTAADVKTKVKLPSV